MALFLLLAGCGSHTKPAIKNPGIATAEQDRKAALSHLQDDIPPSIPGAVNSLVHQGPELVRAQVWDNQQYTLLERTQTELATLRGRWYVRWGIRVEWAIGFIIGTLVAAVIARIVSQFVGGWVGTVLSFGSTAIIGVFSGGLSLVQSFFDNMWFRKTASPGA